MFLLLKKFLVLLFIYLCSVVAACDDILHVNGIAGQNLTVKFILKNKFEPNKQMNMYQNSTKICVLSISIGSCFSCKNHTLPSICISHVSQRSVSLIFTHFIQSGVYHLAVLMPNNDFIESNIVNLTVYPAEYTTTCNTVTATLFNFTTFQTESSNKKSSVLMFVPVLVVAMMLVIILLVLLYWSCRRKTDKSPGESSTSAPQVIPDVTCVDYCVLDFPNRAGEKVRSTEERVEYSPIVFPSRKTSTQDNEIKSTAQQNKLKITRQHEERETEKVSEKPKTSKPKHQKCQKDHT